MGSIGIEALMGERGGSFHRDGDRFEFAVDGGRGTPAGSCFIEPDEYESPSSSRSRPL